MVAVIFNDETSVSEIFELSRYSVRGLFSRKDLFRLESNEFMLIDS